MVNTKKIKNAQLSLLLTVKIKLFPIIYKTFELNIVLQKLLIDVLH